MITISSRQDLSLANFTCIAWQKERAALSSDARDVIAAARAAFLRFCERNPAVPIYGVTSGYGQNAKRRLAKDEEQKFHARSMAVGAASFGEPLPERVVRGILFARLANLIEGHGATSVRIVEAVVDMLNSNRPVPMVPRDGNGCAGEILALYHLFAPLSDAFEMAIKEKSPLTNGAPCAAALVSDAAVAGRRRWHLACEIFSLSIEAFKAPLAAYDPVLAGMWNDPDAAAAFAAINSCLKGAGGDRRGYQAPVSYRILPRVLGRAHRSVRVAEETAHATLSAVTDNPIYLPPDDQYPDGRAFSTGGYHDSHAVPAMDALAADCADLCLIAERHAAKLLDSNVSGLPDKLSRDSSAIAGGASALSYVPMAAVGFLEAARSAATTTLFPGSEGGAFGQDDVVSPVFQAWEKQEAAGLALERTLAILSIVASQALWVTDRNPPNALIARLAVIRDAVPPVDDIALRHLGHELGRLAQALHAEIYSAT